MNRKSKKMGAINKVIIKPLHYLSSPTSYRLLKNREREIWYYKILIYTKNFSIARAFWASSNRIIKTEKKICRLLKKDSVYFKKSRKNFWLFTFTPTTNKNSPSLRPRPVIYAKCSMQRVAKPLGKLFAIIHNHPIDKKVNSLLIINTIL